MTASLHLSGKWNTPDAEVRRATEALIDEREPLAVSHTEAAAHIDALASVADYRLYGSGECALQLRDDISATSRGHDLSPLPIPRRNNARCRALIVKVAASALGPAHTRIVIHLPSGVEGLTGIRRNAQGRVWRDCIAGLQRLIATIDGPVIITGDWNVSLRRAWVRRFLRRAFPGFVFRVPPRGTHGRRAIDFSIVRGFTVTNSDVLRNPASDHRAVLERITSEEAPVTQRHLPKTLPATLRAAGLKVVELDGWHGRGRPASSGDFNPVGVLCHHTASKADGIAGTKILVDGRSDLPGPLAQFGLSRDGTVYVVASGRANHAGKARASGTVAAGDGNALYIGIEAMNDGVGEPWPPAQYQAYVKLAAALCKHVTGNSAATVRGHKETSTTGKIDPRFDMDTFRASVARHLDDRAVRPSAVRTPRWDVIWTTANDIAGDHRATSPSGAAARTIRSLAARFSTAH